MTAVGQVWRWKDERREGIFMLLERKNSAIWHVLILEEDPDWPEEPAGTVAQVLDASLKGFGERIA